MDGDNSSVAELSGSSESLINWGELIAGVDSFHSLVPVAHKMAIAKGWWEDGIQNRPTFEIVANYHAEVSEAWEEYRAGRMEMWHAEGSAKPEGFWIEVADLLIRYADAVGAGREQYGYSCMLMIKPSVAEFVVSLHRQFGTNSNAAAFCEQFAGFHNVDLYAAVRTKLAYNATRPYRHGGKKA